MINFYGHYWHADDGRVYFSGTQTQMTTSDPGYVAWVAAGNVATTWPRDAAAAQTDAALQDVLTPYNLFANLNYYAANVRLNKASGGVIIAGNPFYSDPVSRNTLASAHDYAVANPGHITDWKLANGAFTKLDEPGLAHALQQMATFVQSCFTCESNMVTGIGGGTITTHAQIDAAFNAISNVFP